jgi:hypothetical protein
LEWDYYTEDFYWDIQGKNRVEEHIKTFMIYLKKVYTFFFFLFILYYNNRNNDELY